MFYLFYFGFRSTSAEFKSLTHQNTIFNQEKWETRETEGLGGWKPHLPRELERWQVETSITGNETLTKFNTVVQENLGEKNSENQLTEPSELSNKIQVWTRIMEQKNDFKIERMREDMDNKLEAILKEVKSNKTTSTATNPRSEINEIQDSLPSGSKTKRFIGVRVSIIENSD